MKDLETQSDEEQKEPEQLPQTEAYSEKNQKKKWYKDRKKLADWSALAIVWTWNTLFAIVLCFGILPHLFVPLMQSAFDGEVGWNITLTLLFIIALPVFSIVVLLRYYRREPRKQLMFFYGVQTPLLLLAILRLALLRELNHGVIFMLAVMAVSIASFAVYLHWGIFDPSRQPKDKSEESKEVTSQETKKLWLQMIGNSILLMTGIYFSVLLLFYCLPLGTDFVLEALSFKWLGNAFRLFFNHPEEFFSIVFFAVPLGMFSASLFLGLPFALLIFYTSTWRKSHRVFQKIYGAGKSWGLTGMVGVVLLFGLRTTSQQHQKETFAKLSKTPENKRQLQALLGQKKELRKDLLNAYLASYRYLSTKDKSTGIKKMHTRTFHFSSKFAQKIQDAHNVWISPLLYQGKSFRKDQRKAAKLYQKFFDTSIQKAEKKSILHALGSTYEPRRALAGVLDIGEKKVHINKQELTLKEHDNWATIELHEVYQNQTFRRQEIFYYFSLPEGAVVTGLWLSEGNQKEKAFKYVVAPRGAAQRVYRREVRRRVDPALLSQVGPHQYRLRAFPIPPKVSRRWSRNRTSPRMKPAKLFHLWLQMKVMKQGKHWPLPTLTQKRNVYWSKATKLTLNGQKITRNKKRWLPKSTKENQSSTNPQTRIIEILDGAKVKMTPLPNKPPSFHLKKQHFAIILDRSYSMTPHRKEVTKTFQWLQENIAPHNKIDIYLTSSPYRKERPIRLDHGQTFQADNVIYFGAHQVDGMVKQFIKLRKKQAYNGIFLLTDGHSYDLAKTGKSHYEMNAPFWIIHMGKRLAHAYEDAILATIQKSGGNVSTSLKKAFHRIALLKSLPQKGLLSAEAGYSWHLIPGMAKKASLQSTSKPTKKNLAKKTSNATNRPTGFESLAAQQVIIGMIRTGQIRRLGVLDDIHRLAKTYSIVSPYSSMIVLVNKRQKKALAKAEKRTDRFKRTVDPGKTNLIIPSNPMSVTGTPEPHEWILIFFVLAGLLYVSKQQKVARL